jgi:MOSC domain-containing protein YiiM
MSEGEGIGGNPMQAEIIAVCTSERKGTRKRDVGQAQLRHEWGIEGDAHAGPWHRQVSLLAWESIQKMRDLGLNVGSGSFAENITTRGINLVELPVGTRLRLGDAEVQVTQIGKVCHDRCAIYYQAGDCVMPREGIFVRVLRGGTVNVGDRIQVAADADGPLRA